MNRKDLVPITLAGLTEENLVPEPVAVQHFGNQLIMLNMTNEFAMLAFIRYKLNIYEKNTI